MADLWVCSPDLQTELAAGVTDLRSQLRHLLEEGLSSRLYSGAAVAVMIPGHGLVSVEAGTHAYDDSKVVAADSLFDLASLSKPIVAAAIISLVDEGLLDPDEPVLSHVAVGRGSRAELITLRHLLSHTAGLPSDAFVWKYERMSKEQRLASVLAIPLESSPEATFRYSCLGYIAAGILAEEVSGKSLNALVTERVVTPLELKALTFGPVIRDRAVATEEEFYLARGLVRGEVHDELAWSLGGRVGNAGIFSTASDLLTFSQMLLRRGIGEHTRVLTDAGVRLMSESTLRPEHGAPFGHGMGLRIADPGFMGLVNGLGHTGFTGTMFVIDRERGTAAVLLTNRVHPSRDRVDLSRFRIKFNTLIAKTADASA